MSFPAGKETIEPYLSNIDQLAWAREAELTSGAGRGNRVIDVDNGSGLRFSISPDRGMDIVEASFKGVPFVFRTPGGNRSRMEYDPAGLGWLRTWQGGLMTTCGLRSVGTPDADFGLHGRIDNLPAEDVGITRGWSAGSYRIEVKGSVREAAMFGENLRLDRSISTSFGQNAISVHDRVTNLGAERDCIQIVYHCNFGYPFVSPRLKLDLPPHKVTPRDENAALDLANWMHMPEPSGDNPPEQCFFHDLPADSRGNAVFSMENQDAGFRICLVYDTRTLPRLCQWKLFRRNMYVMGVEPTNATLNGRAADIASGDAFFLNPGESIDFHVRFLFEPLGN